MELYRFIRALTQYWYFAVLLTAIGTLAGLIYVRATEKHTAEVSVAVVEPAVTRAPISGQAQVTFPSVVQSYRVAQRVIDKLGLDMTAKDLKDAVKVKVGRTMVANLVAPLYIISAEDRTKEGAVRLAATVVDEAQAVFVELNSVDPAQVNAAFQKQEDQVRSELNREQAALSDFEQDNDAWMLPALTGGQLSQVFSSRQATHAVNQAQDANTQMTGVLQRNLTAAQGELNRLRGLQPQYDQLTLDVETSRSLAAQATVFVDQLRLAGATEDQLAEAEARLEDVRNQFAIAERALAAFRQRSSVGDLATDLSAQQFLISDYRRQLLPLQVMPGDAQATAAEQQAEFERLASLMPQYEEAISRITLLRGQLVTIRARKFDLVLNGIVTPSAQLKVLDSARIEPPALPNWLYAVLGGVLGLLAGQVIVYLLAYFDRTPRTAEEAQDVVGIPALGRMPRAY